MVFDWVSLFVAFYRFHLLTVTLSTPIQVRYVSPVPYLDTNAPLE